MRFTVTPLGATGRVTPDEIAKRVVEYLTPAGPRLARPGRGPGESPGGSGEPDPSRYYADKGDTPGRWLGRGAAEASLTGAVRPADFARVLAGRDPRTGARLITAQGSAGRRPTLGVGTETRRGPRGEPLYDIADAAAALGCSKAEGEHMTARGERLALAAFLAVAAFASASGDGLDESSYLVPIVDRAGTRWIRDHELSRCEVARAQIDDAEAVTGGGDPNDLLSLAEAASLAKVTVQYLRALCRHYEAHEDEIDAVVTSGLTPKRAYLVGRRDGADRWWVRRADLVAFLRRRRVPAVRVGYDLTLTTEKSLGIVALLGDDDTRGAVLDAIRAGNDCGLAYLETQAAWARAQGEHVGTRGWTVASFEHLTSRALDPFPHHHNIVANTVVDGAGTRRALDARGLYWHAVEASALATAEMRYMLTRNITPRWRRAHHGGWEIDGISDEMVREFSQRRNDIEDAVAELEEAIGRGTTIDELQAVVKDTRPVKKSEDVDALTREWWERARALGLTPEGLAALTDRPPPDIRPPTQDRLFSDLAAPWRLCADSSIFTRGDVLLALVNFGVRDQNGDEHPLLLAPAEFERLADEFLASEHVVELIPSVALDSRVPARLRHQGVFTTREMLGVQRRLFEWYDDGAGRDFGTVPRQVLGQALARHPQLTDEQRELVTAFCTSGHHVQCAVGRAGAGKTSTMRAAVAAWEAVGYEVRGTAVKGEAARVLGAATGVRSETLAWYLVQDDPETTPLHDRMVLIVDEASTIADRDLHKLLALARRKGTTIRLIGDPAQHGAVGAGGMFRLLCERRPGRTPELTHSHRLRDSRDADAADALRDGRIEEALASLAAAQHLHIVDDELDLYLALLRRWWEDHRAGTPHPMVDRRNRTRRHLNRLAHGLLQLAGEVERREVEASGGRAFAAGDRVIARRTNRDLHPRQDPKAYVRNGGAGTVRRIRRGRTRARDVISVAFDGIGLIEVPRSFFDEHEGPGGRLDVGLDHAYALTSYAVQGATFGASASRVDDHASRAETYVDITRGQQANHLYATRGIDPLDGERLPRVPPSPIYDALRDRLEASGPECTAIEIDPAAGANDDLLGTVGLDVLAKGRARVDPGSVEAAVLQRYERARARRVMREAVRAPDPGILSVLPERPEIPYLLEHWKYALGAVAVYRERWRPPPGGDPWAWALGAPVDDSIALAERIEATETLATLVAAATAEALRPHGLAELPSWAPWHLDSLAAAGRCRPDPRATADLYRRVEAYRLAAGISDDELPIEDGHVALGPVPTPAALAATHRLLAHELGRLAETAPTIDLAGV